MSTYDPRDLFPFVEAARRGSFSAAARFLQVTPSAVSKSVARLEKAIGARLFNRSTRLLQLTGEGQEFFERLGAALDGIDQAVESLGETRQGPSGLVRLATTASFGRAFVLPLVKEFLDLYPHVSLEIQFDDGTPNFMQQRFDIAIRRGPLTEGRTVARHLCTTPLVIVASPDYLARRGTPRTPADLVRHECVSIRFASGRPAKWTFVPKRKGGGEGDSYTHHPQGRFVVSANPAEALLDSAMMGLGVTAIAAYFVRPFLDTGQLKLLLPNYTLERDSEIFIQYPHRELLPPKVQVLAEFLIERLRHDERLS